MSETSQTIAPRASRRRETLSVRARLLALFVVLALVLGGGGTPNPMTEVLLEFAFAGVMVAWILFPGNAGGVPSARNREVLALTLLPLVIPLVQLVPLPPAIWSALPGRENAVAALSLVGEQHSWRPLSLSPNRTLASLLAILPAAFCVYAISRLNREERRLVLGVIVFMALVTALLGVVQLTDRGSGFNLYSEHTQGWVTGFQANRNATADLLLIALLALAVLAGPVLRGQRKPPFRLDRRTFSVLSLGAGALFLTATVMTGSRTGTFLVLIAVAAAVLIFTVSGKAGVAGHGRFAPLVIGLLVLAALLGIFATLARETAVGQVAARYSDLDTTRAAIWTDTRFSIGQYWPVGFGLGGFEPAMLPAERLEVLDPAIPNRAHNDYLEIGLEAGALGYAVLAIGIILCLMLIWRGWRERPGSRDQVIFGGTVLLLVALHSIVDYPLRSMAIACLSGIAAGMLAAEAKSAVEPVAAERANRVKGLA